MRCSELLLSKRGQHRPAVVKTIQKAFFSSPDSGLWRRRRDLRIKSQFMAPTRNELDDKTPYKSKRIYRASQIGAENVGNRTIWRIHEWLCRASSVCRNEAVHRKSTVTSVIRPAFLRICSFLCFAGPPVCEISKMTLSMRIHPRISGQSLSCHGTACWQVHRSWCLTVLRHDQ